MQKDLTSNEESRAKVLLIAYGCEPGKGSEQGTGWNLSTRLADKYDVTVVTRCNNREPIESELARNPCPGINFEYHDAGGISLWLKKLGIMSVQVYYALWQLTLTWRFAKSRELNKYDIVHHLTFNTFEIPPLLLLNTEVKTVWGPVGGGQTAPWGMRSYFGGLGRWKELLRTVRVHISSWNPLCRMVLGRASLVLFANHETESLLGGACRNHTGRMVDVGVDAEKFSVPTRDTSSEDRINLLFAGKFEKRKGASVVLDVFKLAAARVPSLTCTFIGDGEDRGKIMREAKELGLSERIQFPGKLSHDEMATQFSEADMYIFASLRDTTGAIVLEAMASGLPTVCFDHHGARIMVADGCGIRVDVDASESAVSQMVEAVIKLAENPELRHEMGKRARARALDLYAWGSKTEAIDQWYQKLLDTNSGD